MLGWIVSIIMNKIIADDRSRLLSERINPASVAEYLHDGVDVVVLYAVLFRWGVHDIPVPANGNPGVRCIGNFIVYDAIVAAQQSDNAHTFRIYFSDTLYEIIRNVVA